MLEQQLSDKTRAGREHVEELSKLRAQLGRERSALAQVRQEERRRAMEELSQVKQLQANQCSEFESQVERVRQEKASLDQEVGRLRGSLKGNGWLLCMRGPNHCYKLIIIYHDIIDLGGGETCMELTSLCHKRLPVA